ncbi:hypothetical protein HPB52_013154 [Rhipicephalus sanguineus]|uniref:HTH psq-type domain-containing protein n=1 Tax=Rhipicephalus sanguineus TaxID=34632 RepID=A0A9D4QDK5_RHISA|nr:hypothetical protein HPB52_013154 [Rhipicephalus sanguineus]
MAPTPPSSHASSTKSSKRGNYSRLTMEKKAAIIRQAQSGQSQADVAKQFDILKQTISDYLKDKVRILAAAEKSSGSRLKNVSQGAVPMEVTLEKFTNAESEIELCAELTDDETVRQVLEDDDSGSDNEKPSKNVTLADMQADLLVRQRSAPQKHIDQFFKPLSK